MLTTGSFFRRSAAGGAVLPSRTGLTIARSLTRRRFRGRPAAGGGGAPVQDGVDHRQVARLLLLLLLFLQTTPPGVGEVAVSSLVFGVASSSPKAATSRGWVRRRHWEGGSGWR